MEFKQLNGNFGVIVEKMHKTFNDEMYTNNTFLKQKQGNVPINC